MNNQPHISGSGQAKQAKTGAVSIPILNRLSTSGKRRLLRGLERFVNTDESEEAYVALSKAWPTFWPVSLFDSATGQLLNWHPKARALLLVYRDVLRSLWRGASTAPLSLEFLLGLTDDLRDALKTARYEDETYYATDFAALDPAAEQIVGVCPQSSVAVQPHLYLGWNREKPSYGGVCDFQNAVWLLWSQRWRARVCKQCQNYFVAQKKHQLYCSVECSREGHRASARRWAERSRAERSERNKPRSKLKGETR